MYQAKTYPPCPISNTLTDPLCSPVTLLLFATYITLILTALYIILRSLHNWYQQHQYETELENEAYERLLRQLAEADSNFDAAGTDHGQRWVTNDTLNVNAEPEEDMDDADDSDSDGAAIKRTSLRRKLKRVEFTVPLIGDARYGTIAQRRSERS